MNIFAIAVLGLVLVFAAYVEGFSDGSAIACQQASATERVP
jgi:hypothetical protein